jgi:hypothetical protein
MRKTKNGKPNPNLYCGQCRLNEIAKEERKRAKRNRDRREQYHRTRPTAVVAAEGVAVARALGHTVFHVYKDNAIEGAIGECEDCGLYMVVDLDESPKPYGGTQHFECGKKPAPPAVRRSAFEMDWGTASAANERPEQGEDLWEAVDHIRTVVGDYEA